MQCRYELELRQVRVVTCLRAPTWSQNHLQRWHEAGLAVCRCLAGSVSSCWRLPAAARGRRNACDCGPHDKPPSRPKKKPGAGHAQPASK